MIALIEGSLKDTFRKQFVATWEDYSIVLRSGCVGSLLLGFQTRSMIKISLELLLTDKRRN
jgi:hypothetical protein